MIKYKKISKTEEIDIGELKVLYGQLSSRELSFTEESLGGIIKNDDVTAFGAYDHGKLIGIASLHTIRTPLLVKSLVEEVIVDEGHRGKGIGKELMRYLIEEAKEAGADYIDLTSSPKRVAANGLYQSLGFEQRETNVYRLNL